MRAVSAAASAVRHSLGAVLEALIIAAIIAALLLALGPIYKPADLLAGTEQAAAAKGGWAASSSSATLELAMVYDANGNGGPNHGDTVTFEVWTSATDRPWVRVVCNQGGAAVSTSTAGFFDAYLWAQNYTLASTVWTSGAADCTATMYMIKRNGRTATLATLAFPVAE